MLTITCASLSGGQGKSTVSLFLGRVLARLGYSVLMVDADPQSSLTFYLGHDVEPSQPTLLEVLKKQVKVEDGIYELSHSNMWIIPSDEGLDTVQDFLASSGMGAVVLKKRLSEVADLFTFCIIDSPPQRSQICLTAVGAADAVLIPAEASSKGLNSLIRFLELTKELTDVDAFTGTLLGVIPFRERRFGKSQAIQSVKSLEGMREAAQDIPILPAIPESEQYKKALDSGVTLAEFGYPHLELPFLQVVELLKEKCLLKMPSVG